MSAENTGGFTGIFKGLKKMVFTEDYLEAKNPPEKSPAVPEAKFTPSSPVTSNLHQTGLPASNVADEEMVKKIYTLLESMNKAGVDFFELWNAAEAMGGSNISNLQNAFTTFKILGLTKERILQTGEEYCAELRSLLNSDIEKKRAQKESLTQGLASEKQKLQRDKLELENKQKLITDQLAETTTRLGQIDAEYQPKINEVDHKMHAGVNALNVVVGRINTVLEIVKNDLK